MATPSEIKESYRAMMKTCHPDKMSSDQGDDLAVVLNLIYTILMDDSQRAEYDILAGFVQSGKNPFDGCHSHGNRKRTEMAKYVFVDEYSCIGCYGCANVDSSIFTLNTKDDYGRARCIRQDGNVDKIEMAMDVCPVSCIHFVTAQQLTLLEEVMAKLGRVEVFLLMRSQSVRVLVVYYCLFVLYVLIIFSYTHICRVLICLFSTRQLWNGPGDSPKSERWNEGWGTMVFLT